MSPCLSYFCRNPVLELFCWWKFAAEDQRVETGFVDDYCVFILISIKNHHFTPIFFINMAVNISTTVLVPEGISYILTNEPWLSWDLYCPNSAELWVSEYCWGFCWRRRFWKMSRPGDVPSLCAFFQRYLFVTHPHSSRRKNAYSILPPGERDRINFVKYCWLYSSISLRNQSLFPEEHFPSHARKINPLAVYSIRPTILPVTSPLYSRIFSALLL